MENSKQFEELLARYDYDLPESFIAQQPAEPRDSAKLLAYDRKSEQVSFDTFTNLPSYLPKNAVLVFNQTKVLPARFILKKPSGGKVSCLYIATVGDAIKVMANKPLDIRSTLTFDADLFTVLEKVDRYYLLKPSFPVNQILSFLDQCGETPIPPYIKNSPLSEKELREKYQTVFAKETGSVAAPTASLHFTEGLMDRLKSSGIGIQFVTLHVNLGTFAALTEEQVASGKLHTETYFIDPTVADFLNNAKKDGRPIVAVGTTVARTLESAANLLRHSRESGNHPASKVEQSQIPGLVRDDTLGQLQNLSGSTDLFIREGYRWKFVDGMITNFHVPKSSLLMMVATLVGREKILGLYEQAKQHDFKFFSFGDGMLLL